LKNVLFTLRPESHLSTYTAPSNPAASP
jgi:hypothetical protein